jgi:hypothetical protein
MFKKLDESLTNFHSCDITHMYIKDTHLMLNIKENN